MTVNHQALAVHFDSVPAGTAEEREVAWALPGRWRIDTVLVAPSTASAANGTNFTTVSLETNDGAGGAYTSVGALDTSSVGFALGTTREMTMVQTEAREIQQGSALRIRKVNDGTGAVFDGGVTVLASRVD